MKHGLVFLTLLLVVGSTGAMAQVDPCLSTAFLGGAAPYCFMSCPTGDGLTPAEAGWFIGITVMDADTIPIADILDTDIWLEDCVLAGGVPFVPCGGGMGASLADGPTDQFGMTTMSMKTFTVSGCGLDGPAPFDAVRIVVQGVPLRQPPNCSGTVLCLAVRVRSVDVTGEGVVGLGDLSLFAQGLLGAYNPCVDFTCNGAVNLSDLALFSGHFLEAHTCP